MRSSSPYLVRQNGGRRYELAIGNSASWSRSRSARGATDRWDVPMHQLSLRSVRIIALTERRNIIVDFKRYALRTKKINGALVNYNVW
ncbi:hypothetical protein JR316_0010474 [Psilocybe cubensis]|uniref:Uncharacterized protein n=1 Tax=Psilocybe cubensis TaxID=181762 RepID=A0ACB8GMD8_PSICU|nr:hypothetical protein JR316_0010474 [Psilocybe cubensis]KAH9476562.1 hypothetical protein JR316_0010474 [Psilocybe cubensis]